MRKARFAVGSSSKRVNKTKLVQPAGVQDAHPAARGLRRGIKHQMGQKTLEQDHAETQQHIERAFAGEGLNEHTVNSSHLTRQLSSPHG